MQPSLGIILMECGATHTTRASSCTLPLPPAAFKQQQTIRSVARLHINFAVSCSYMRKAPKSRTAVSSSSNASSSSSPPAHSQQPLPATSRSLLHEPSSPNKVASAVDPPVPASPSATGPASHSASSSPHNSQMPQRDRPKRDFASRKSGGGVAKGLSRVSDVSSSLSAPKPSFAKVEPFSSLKGDARIYCYWPLSIARQTHTLRPLSCRQGIGSRTVAEVRQHTTHVQLVKCDE